MFFLHNVVALSHQPLTKEHLALARGMDSEARFFFMPAHGETDSFYIIMLYVHPEQDSEFPDLSMVKRAFEGFNVTRWNATSKVSKYAIEMIIDPDTFEFIGDDAGMFELMRAFTDIEGVEDGEVVVVNMNVSASDVQTQPLALPAPKPEAPATTSEPPRIGLTRLQYQPYWSEVIVDVPAKLDLVQEILNARPSIA